MLAALLTLLFLHLINALPTNGTLSSPLPPSTPSTNSPSLTASTSIDATGRQQPPNPATHDFDTLLQTRVQRLNSTSPYRPLFLLSVYATSYPWPSTQSSSFTTLHLQFYSPSENIVLSSFNNFAEPSHWTELARVEAAEEILSQVVGWGLGDKVSGIEAQMRVLMEVDREGGPFKNFYLARFRADPWGVGQVYWMWQTVGGETLWQGDQDHVVRRAGVDVGIDVFAKGRSSAVEWEGEGGGELVEVT